MEELPGVKLYLLSGKLRGEHIFQMSYALIGPETMTIQLWVHPETFDLHRARIEALVLGESEPVIWQLDFWDFGKVVELQPPVITP